ncbi:hypothetical protein AKJ16_DCAP18007 [Drosera capensis]
MERAGFLIFGNCGGFGSGDVWAVGLEIDRRVRMGLARVTRIVSRGDDGCVCLTRIVVSGFWIVIDWGVEAWILLWKFSSRKPSGVIILEIYT